MPDSAIQTLADLITGQSGPRELRVYTGTFNLRRQIWHIWEWVSPMPLTLWPAAAAAVWAFVFLQFGLMKLATDTVGFPLNVIAMVVGCIVVYKLFDRPQIEGRSLNLYVRSLARYWLLEPRALDGHFCRRREPKRIRIGRLEAWSPRE